MRTLTAVRADRAAAIEPQLARLDSNDRKVLADAVEVLRRLLDNAAAAPSRNTL
jgi:hypothetical protein